MFSVRARASTPELVVTTFNSSFYVIITFNYIRTTRRNVGKSWIDL